MNIRGLLLAGLCAGWCAVVGGSDIVTLMAPDFGKVKPTEVFALYCHPGYKATLSSGQAEDRPEIRLLVDEAPEKPKNNQQLQLRTLLRKPLKAGTEYRIAFRCRSDRPAWISFRVQESVRPWESPTEKAGGSMQVTPEWKSVEYCFTVAKESGNVVVWTPNFELGRLGAGNCFHLADLKIESLD